MLNSNPVLHASCMHDSSSSICPHMQRQGCCSKHSHHWRHNGVQKALAVVHPLVAVLYALSLALLLKDSQC